MKAKKNPWLYLLKLRLLDIIPKFQENNIHESTTIMKSVPPKFIRCNYEVFSLKVVAAVLRIR